MIDQSMKDIEIICFNDASTDNTLSILKEYQNKDNRLHIIDSQVNIKQGGGRNKGLLKARSPFVMFVDSDDWVDSKFVENHYKIAVETDADIVIADYYECRGKLYQPTCLMGKSLPEDTEYLKKRYLECGGPVWASIYKKELFVLNNLFFPEGLFYEDNAVMPSLILSARKIVKVDEFLYYYRRNPESTTGQKNDNRFFDRLETAIIAYNNTKRLGLEEKYHTELIDVFLKQFYSNTIFGIMERFRPMRFDKMKEINKTVLEHVNSKELWSFIHSRRKRERIILSLNRYSPHMAFYLNCFFDHLSKLKNAIK